MMCYAKTDGRTEATTLAASWGPWSGPPANVKNVILDDISSYSRPCTFTWMDNMCMFVCDVWLGRAVAGKLTWPFWTHRYSKPISACVDVVYEATLVPSKKVQWLSIDGSSGFELMASAECCCSTTRKVEKFPNAPLRSCVAMVRTSLLLPLMLDYITTASEPASLLRKLRHGCIVGGGSGKWCRGLACAIGDDWR